MVSSPVACLFQSTLSVRRATLDPIGTGIALAISIHALRKESDSGHGRFPNRPTTISIHALRKESDAVDTLGNVWFIISIHALRKESDLQQVEAKHRRPISIHALRKESDQMPLPLYAWYR